MTSTIAQKKYPDFKAAVSLAVFEAVSDPDFGMALSKKAGDCLRAARNAKVKRLSLSEIKRAYY